MANPLLTRVAEAAPRNWRDRLPVCIPGILPGYGTLHRRRYEIMLEQIGDLLANLRLGRTAGTPWIEVAGIDQRFHGFWSDRAALRQWFALRSSVAGGLPQEYFRLVTDFVSRYRYPHMLPDAVPPGITPEKAGGFHLQHLDHLAAYRDVDPEHLRRVFALGPDDVIVDGGAFLGFGDLRVAPMVPRGRIYALEAKSECFALLERNVQHNRVDNVIPIHQALWRAETVMDLECGTTQANSLVAEVCAGKAIEKVQATSIDGLVAARGLTRLDLLSLTLNGAEVEALQGAARTLRELKPRIRLAGWYRRGGVPVGEIARGILEPAGYRVHVAEHGNLLAHVNET